jgi:uncharacterized protein YdeI (BOF family)
LQAKEIAKYVGVFIAGAFAVLGVIGFNSLMQTPSVNSAPAPSLESQEQSTSIDAANSNTEAQSASSETVKESAGESNKPSKSPSPVSRPSFETTPVAGVSSISELVRNTLVTIQGTVTRASEEDEFILKDSTGSVQVYTGRTFFTVNVGDVVTVTGLVDEAALLEIYADEITFEDGTVIKVRHWR